MKHNLIYAATMVICCLFTEHAVKVAPNNGALKSRVSRVSHMGEHHPEDLQALIKALKDVTARLPLPARATTLGEA